MTDYSVIFSIIDKYSAPILAMEEKLRHLGEVGAQANKMMTPHQHLFANLAQDAEHLTEKVRTASQSITEMGSRVGELLGPLAALGAAGSVAGIVEMTHNFAEATEQLQIGAKISGQTTQQLQSLQYAAKMTGVQADSLQHSMGILNKNLGAAGTGRNKDVVTLLGHLHIALRGANGQILSSAQLLPKLADAFAHTSDPAMQALMATKLFGRAGLDLLPLLDQGSAGLNEFTEAFKRYGYTLSAQDVAAGTKFNETWKNMQVAISGLTDDISAKLAPILTPVLQQVADLIVKYRGLIAEDFQSSLASFVNYATKMPWQSIITGIESFGSETLKVIDYIGGFKTIIIATGAAITVDFFGPLVVLTAQMARFAFMTSVIVSGALVKMGAAMLEVIPMIGGLKDAWAAAQLVFGASPLGVLIAATVAAGVVAYELWKHWDTVKEHLIAIWHAIGDTFHAVWDPIKSALDDFETQMTDLKNFLNGNFGGGPNANINGLGLPASSAAPPMVKGGGWDNFGVANSGKVDVTINHVNAPAGTTTSLKTSGNVGKVQQNLGYNNMAAAF